jgi:hypothetical protein
MDTSPETNQGKPAKHISEFTLVELKAIAYDELRKQRDVQNNLALLTKAIADRETNEPSSK